MDPYRTCSDAEIFFTMASSFLDTSATSTSTAGSGTGSSLTSGCSGLTSVAATAAIAFSSSVVMKTTVPSPSMVACIGIQLSDRYDSFVILVHI